MALGDEDKRSLGAELGAMLGTTEWTSLGESVGVALGDEDKRSLGAELGAMLGTTEGTSLGESVGKDVGVALGVALRLGDGESEGKAVGSAFVLRVASSSSPTTTAPKLDWRFTMVKKAIRDNYFSILAQ